MALHVTASEVQTWLEKTKCDIHDTVDPELESTASVQVLSALGQSYATSAWVDATSTPALVRKVIAMLVAAWFYERQYAEDNAETSTYGGWLERKAYALLTGIVSGITDLLDVPGAPSVGFGQADFWPNDTTETLNPDDAAKFTMAKLF